MRPFERRVYPSRGDGLRLLALGRVPRCERCARYRVLAQAPEEPAGPLAALPPVPAFCTLQLCAPLAARYRATAARSAAFARSAMQVVRG
jgi:hypothetical protein